MATENELLTARIAELEIDRRHLQNELRLTREEHEEALAKYLEIHFHLEKKVADRTRQLDASNRQLSAEIEERKKVESEREALLADLQHALEKVKILSGFLPICASCKKIRDEEGQWRQVEEYISTHSDAKFSHGMCPNCAEKIYPELSRKIRKIGGRGDGDAA